MGTQTITQIRLLKIPNNRYKSLFINFKKNGKMLSNFEVYFKCALSESIVYSIWY